MAAGLECDVHRGFGNITCFTERDHFRMRSSSGRMKAFADDTIILDDNTAHHWIWAGTPPRAFCKGQGAPHVVSIDRQEKFHWILGALSDSTVTLKIGQMGNSFSFLRENTTSCIPAPRGELVIIQRLIRCLWRIPAQAATGSWYRPLQ